MKQITNELLQRRINSENKVMNEFAKRLNVTPRQIIEHNKSELICVIRHLYCKLRCDIHGLSYTAMGREIGRADTTVRYGVMQINDLLYLKNKKTIEMWNRVKDISVSHIQPCNSSSVKETSLSKVEDCSPNEVEGDYNANNTSEEIRRVV